MRYLVLERIAADPDAREVEKWRTVAVMEHARDEKHACEGAALYDTGHPANPPGEGTFKALPWSDHEFPPSERPALSTLAGLGAT